MRKAGNANDQMGDTFVYFPTFRPQLRAIKNKDAELRMRYAIEDYGIDGTLPDFSDIDPLGVMDGMFEQFRYAIDTAKANRKKQSTVNSENGKKGGATRGNQNARKYPVSSETSENDQKQPKSSKTSLNVNVNVNGNGDRDSIESYKGADAQQNSHRDYDGLIYWMGNEGLEYLSEKSNFTWYLTPKGLQEILASHSIKEVKEVLLDIENRRDLHGRFKSFNKMLNTFLNSRLNELNR